MKISQTPYTVLPVDLIEIKKLSVELRRAIVRMVRRR
jgi:hypothetical protein